VDAAYFRAKALHCRELAFTAPDSETQAGLLTLADEYLKRALEIEWPFQRYRTQSLWCAGQCLAHRF
jgi:hypothetical protein